MGAVNETSALLKEIERLKQELAQTAKDITESKRKVERQAFLLKLTDELSHLFNPHDMVLAVSTAVGSYLDLSSCIFVELNDAQQQATVYQGWNREDVPGFQPTFPMDDYLSTAIQRAGRAGETIVIRNTGNDPGVNATAYARLKVSALVIIPLHRAGKWTHFFTASTSAPRDWSKEDIALLQDTAYRVFQRIERARTEQANITRRKLMEYQQKYIVQLNDALNSLHDPVAIQQAVAQTAIKYFNTERCYYCEIIKENAVINREAFKGDLPSVAGSYPLHSFPLFKKVIDAGQPFVVHDSQTTSILDEPLRELCIQLKVISFIDVPVIKNGIPVGILCLVQSTPRTWTDAEVDMARETAERTWTAVERSRAEEALRNSEERLSGELKNMIELQRVSSELSGPGTDTELYMKIIRAAMGLMRADMGSMQMYYPREKKLGLLGQIGFAPESAAFWDWVDLESGSTCARALNSGARFFTPDVGKLDYSNACKDLYYYKLSGIVAVQSTPLIARDGQMVGMFSTHWRTEHYPSEHDFRLLDILARQAADLIERKQAEHVLKDSELQLKALVKVREDFIGVASHELKTPITSMKAYAEIIQDRLDQTDQTLESNLIRKMTAQIDRLTILINDLLDTTRMAEGKLVLKLEPLDIRQLLQERMEEIKYTTSHQLQYEAKELLLVMADRERIGQVITNLLSNAIKYSPKSAAITISAIDVNGGVQVSVSDEGVGIADEDQKRVFDRFFRVAGNNMDTYPGMGLGLYISAQIIQRHGGTFFLESELGRGSTFTFTLPGNNKNI